MKRLIYLLLIASSATLAQEKDNFHFFNLGVVSNVSKAQIGIRTSYYNNSEDVNVGAYLEFKAEAKPDRTKGYDYSDLIDNNFLNHQDRGIVTGRNYIINGGVVKKIFKQRNVFAYLGLGVHTRSTYQQMHDPFRNMSPTGHYFYEIETKTDVVLNVGVEGYFKSMTYNVGYDFNIDGINIGIGFRIIK